MRDARGSGRGGAVAVVRVGAVVGIVARVAGRPLVNGCDRRRPKPGRPPCDDAVADATGQQPTLFRPPYGVMTTAAHLACRRLGLTPVLWTCWGEDWRRRATPGPVQDAVLRDLRGGGTILLHDSDCTAAPGSWRTTLRALPRILDTCETQGWKIGPLREHAVPGTTLRPNR
ncbi:hypothetical protein ACIBL8_32065 [Streptomyces sp. NPDC050523]|uniref:hypothetical protein n=1 Tax=Streptomyces sp. NPDC050523 TaxID=3365622 RepID=UPI0037AA1B4D